MDRPADEAQAVALFQAGRIPEAENAFRAVLAHDPGNARALHALGVIAMQGRRFDEAAGLLAKAVDAEPRDALAHYHLGSALRNAGRRDAARDAFQRALALDAQAGDPRLRLGTALTAAREALALLEAESGDARRDAGDLAGAGVHYRAALAANPRLAEAAVNAGSVALEGGDRREARAMYEEALRVKPGLADAQYALGLIALFEHDFARGWAGYEKRFETNPPVAAIQPPRRAPARDLSAVRRLAVRAEQGLGDQILFSTLLPELVRRNVAAVVELDPRLAPIYRRSLPQLDFDPRALDSCDHELPIGSLPSLFRTSVESFEAQPRALLLPDPERGGGIRSALGSGPHVAISWRSFQKAGRRHVGERKSAPLEAFAILGRSARLVDVQYGDASEERRAFDERHRGVRVQLPGVDLRDDIEGILATLAACDLVVTTSNVTAHFAGAIGKPTLLVYLAANPPFHYWAPRADGRSLWYPSVEIVSDARWQRWETALEAIAGRLGAFLNR